MLLNEKTGFLPKQKTKAQISCAVSEVMRGSRKFSQGVSKFPEGV